MQRFSVRRRHVKTCSNGNGPAAIFNVIVDCTACYSVAMERSVDVKAVALKEGGWA